MIQACVKTRVPASHPALPGHFPDQPLVPGVVLLALVHEQARDRLGLPSRPSRWSRIKFLAPLRPEVPIQIELSGDAERFSFRIQFQDGQTVARGQCSHDPLA